MITLGGIELNPSLQWVNRFETFSIAQTVRLTRGGGAKIYQQRLFVGRPVSLVADEETGWFTNEMREEVLALAEEMDQTFLFSFFGEEYQVVFNHTDPPAVSFTKILYRQVPDDDDWFMGKISLITV
jgi:hypothetical protein